MIRRQVVLGLVLLSLAFPRVVMAVDEEELKFGFFADRLFLSSHTVLLDEALNERINEIGNRIAKVSDRPDMSYTFRVINDPTINAYSAAGGFVYINTGLLDVLESEDELAALIAHEIGHISRSHHINFQYSEKRKSAVGQRTGILVSTLAYGLVWSL